jgi:hypothetical protein
MGPFNIGITSIIFTSISASLAGIVPLNKGGTNANLTASAGSVVYSNSTALALSAVGSAGQLLQSTGTTAPTWTTATYPSTSSIANTYLISNGTNFTLSSFTFNLGGSFSSQGIITYSGASTAIFNISGPTNVTFPLSGTLATTSQLMSNVNVIAATQNMLSNVSYTTNYTGGIVTYLLPTTSAIGDVIEITGNSTGGWTITQNAGQNIQMGVDSTTIGVSGSLTSSNRYDSIRLKCTVVNTTWVVQPNVTAAFTIV